MPRPRLVATLTICAIAATATAALAQDRGVRRVGARIGGSLDPDQFVFGLHLNAGMLGSRIRFRPSVEVGVGADQTTLVGNFDALYLAHRTRTVQILAGAGLGVGGRWFSTGSGSRFEDRDPSSEGLIGLNLVAGLEWGTRPVANVQQSRGSQTRWLVELRAGVGDLPVFKTIIGVNF